MDAMFQLTGYLGGFDEDIVREDVDFLVTCCGHYRLLKRPYFETARPEGRQDYQLIFAVSGSFHADVGGESLRVGEGEAVLYRPGEPQRYDYRLEDGPDIYWMHFTGRRAESILTENGLTDGHVRCGLKPEYSVLLERMIRELQLRRPGFELLCAGCGMEVLALMGRAAKEGDASPANEAMEIALARLHRDFRENVEIAALARELNLSESWFIRMFRAHTGLTPQRYLTGLRLREARELLSSSSLNMGEIAALCGYDNPLYFSRIFRKYVGASPSEYRREKRRI